MPLTKGQIINAIHLICRKYDFNKPKGTTFDFLKNSFNLKQFKILAFNEINGWLPGVTHVLKHQRIVGLKTLSTREISTEDSPLFESLITDLADFLSNSQIKAARLIEEKATASKKR